MYPPEKIQSRRRWRQRVLQKLHSALIVRQGVKTHTCITLHSKCIKGTVTWITYDKRLIFSVRFNGLWTERCGILLRATWRDVERHLAFHDSGGWMPVYRQKWKWFITSKFLDTSIEHKKRESNSLLYCTDLVKKIFKTTSQNKHWFVPCKTPTDWFLTSRVFYLLYLVLLFFRFAFYM